MLDLQIKKILPNGDCAVLISFAESVNRLDAIHVLATELRLTPVLMKAQVVNVIPAVDSLVMVFDKPIDFASIFAQEINQLIDNLTLSQGAVKIHEIPICYDPTVAIEVMAVCESLGLTHRQLIAQHTSSKYRVDMLGFLPGFAYLSGNHATLNLPRKPSPDLYVEAGSVAIADQLTGLYSLSSPGGWHVIGRTPMRLLDWANELQPMKLSPLDVVTFKSISSTEFNNYSRSDDGH